MLAIVIASLALGQSPDPAAAERAPAPVPAAARPAPETPLSPAARRQADLKRLIEQRKARHARGTAARNRAFGFNRRPAADPAAGQPGAADPAALQAANAQIQALSQQNMALLGIANAAQRRAGVAEAQYRLNSQMAGAPQVFVPGQGMMPYQYGIAPPVFTYPQNSAFPVAVPFTNR